MLVFNLTDQVRETIQQSLYQLLLQRERLRLSPDVAAALRRSRRRRDSSLAARARCGRTRRRRHRHRWPLPRQLVAPAQRDRAADEAAGQAAAATVGTPIFAALRPVRKSRIAQPRERAIAAQLGVGVDRDRGAGQRQHRQVVGRVAVGGAAGQVEALALGQRQHRLGLRRAVHQLADQPAGVLAVDHLGDRARARRSAPAGGR